MFASPTALSVGEKLALPDTHQVSALQSALESELSVVVVCVLSTECDATKKIIRRLDSLTKKWKTDAQFVGFVTSHENDLNDFIKTHQFGFKVVGDFENTVANLLGADRTPAFFVFDSERALRYRGPIDNSTLLPRAATKHFLASAIEAVLDGRNAPASIPFVGRPILEDH